MALPMGPLPPRTREVPYDLPAEEAVLGALILDREAIIKVAPWLQPSDFYREVHGWIYEAMLALLARAEPPDLVTLASELDRHGRLEQAGGLAYLAGLMARVPTAVHVEYYGHIVERCSALRRLISVGGQIAGLGYEEGLDLPVVLDRAEELLRAVTTRPGAVEDSSVGAILQRYLDRIAQREGGLLTGYHDLDTLLGGPESQGALYAPDLIIVAARPAVGKSAFGLSLAYHLGQGGVPVGFATLEMSIEQMGAHRLLAIATGISSQRLRSAVLTVEEWYTLSEACAALDSMPIYFDDQARTVAQVEALARRWRAEYGIKLLILDYLQLMTGRRQENRVLEIGEITRSLKGLARDLGIPIVAMSQLSRGIEARTGHQPMLSDLREGGSIEQDADIVMFLYREELYDPLTPRRGECDLIIAKHRNGPTGTVTVGFYGPATYLYDPHSPPEYVAGTH